MIHHDNLIKRRSFVLFAGAEAIRFSPPSDEIVRDNHEINYLRMPDSEDALDWLHNNPCSLIVIAQSELRQGELSAQLSRIQLINPGVDIILLVDPSIAVWELCDLVGRIYRLRPFPTSGTHGMFEELVARLLNFRAIDIDPVSGEVCLWFQSELERLTELAMYDGLTMVYRRSYLMERAQEEFERAMRTEQRLLCVMMDIDHFKQVNDTYGHAIGDQVLQTLARIIEQHRRPYDLFGRCGGEEFMLLCPQVCLSEGAGIAERLRQLVGNHEWKASGLPGITISLGVAEYLHSKLGDLHTLCKAADLALYKAKQTGRNRVCVHALQDQEILSAMVG